MKRLLVRHKASPARTRAGKWRVAFLKALSKTISVTEAAKAAGISRQTAYSHKAADPIFAAKWDASLAESLDGLEAELYCFALGLKGCDAGTANARVKAAIDILRSHRPEVWRERQEIGVLGGFIHVPMKEDKEP